MGGRVRELLPIAGFALLSKFALLPLLFVLPQFDTSARIIVNQQPSSYWILDEIVSRLMVWDNVYFTTLAQEGEPRYEHEFAFSGAWVWLIRTLAPGTSLAALSLTAAFLSLLAHVAACCTLFYLTDIRQFRKGSPVLPAQAASFYALCPAGIFLMSGYKESLFALCSFLGLLVFLKYQRYIFAALIFAVSVQIRANGLLWGVLFAVTLAGEMLRPTRSLKLYRIASLIIGGSLIAIAFIVPQYLIYQKYCPGLDWCDQLIPSVYTYVQSEYWDNGFLRYWKVANIPNFVIASPTLILLVQSSRFLYQRHLVGLSLVQLLTVVSALLFWNVQIITRVASCFPGPYWYIAAMAADPQQSRKAYTWLGLFSLWNAVHGVLFGAFLPPA